MRKHDSYICCLQEIHLRTKDIHRLIVKGWKQILQANAQGGKSCGSNSTMRENILQNKGQKRYPERHFIVLKGRINQEDINIINIHASNIGAPKHIRKILEDFKKDIDSNTLIIGNLIPHCQQWVDFPNKISTKILWH